MHYTNNPHTPEYTETVCSMCGSTWVDYCKNEQCYCNTCLDDEFLTDASVLEFINKDRATQIDFYINEQFNCDTFNASRTLITIAKCEFEKLSQAKKHTLLLSWAHDNLSEILNSEGVSEL